MKIPIAKTVFSESEFQNIMKPLQSGWVVQGPYVKEFEDKWSEFTGAEHSIAVSSCTTALHLSLVAMGIGAGDEVIVPSFTWIATINVVEHTGAKPVFCDIDLNTFNIDTNNIKRLKTKKTKAIIPVHLFGLAANVDKILEVSNKYHLYVIEDAACGFAAKYKGKHVGNFGNTGCFSFHPRKAITTGEGGMITTSDKKLAEKMIAMRDHGSTSSDLARHLAGKPYILPEFPYAGYNYRMTDIQASIGSSQMDRAQEIYEKRTYWAGRYNEALKNIDWLRCPVVPDGYTHGYQSYVCMFMPDEISIENIEKVNSQRNRFMEYLQENGIATRPGTHAVHTLQYYKRKYSFKEEDFPNSAISYKCSVSLPLFPSLSEDEFEYIIEKINNYKF